MTVIGLRKTLGGMVVLAFVLMLTWAFWPRPLAVSIAQIDRGPMRVVIMDEGQTRVKDVYRVSAPVAGRVLRTEVDVGDHVIAGKTVIASLLPSAPSFLDARAFREAEAAVRAAEATVELALAEQTRTSAEVDYAILEANRIRDLVDRRVKPQVELDKAELELKTARAADSSAKAVITQRRAELETARAVLIDPATPETVEAGHAVGVVGIKAPVSGRILSVLQESEDVVSAGTPLVELGDPERIEVVVDLLSTNAVKVTPDDLVEIVDWGGDEILTGRVRRVEPTGFTKVSSLGIEEQRVNVIVEPTEDGEWNRLGHGFRVQARVIIWSSDDVLRIPSGALFRLDRDWAVFRAVDDRAQLTTVRVGHIASDWVEIEEGLDVGDQVILHPARSIEDGASISNQPPH